MPDDQNKITRRSFLKKMTQSAAVIAIPGIPAGTTLEEFLQWNFREMTPEEKIEAVERLERRYKEQFKKDVTIRTTPAREDVLFGYALNIKKCIGCRRCVYACMKENNQSRDPQIQWIRVLEFKDGNMNLEESEHYYRPKEVPVEGHYFMPVQCHQCENPPCVKVCPVQATWKEPDGIIVIDYNWCIGCRFCIAACPYWARRFNWGVPNLPPEELNTSTHYLGNRPRMKGVVEKCTFCIQRTREKGGRYPACLEACPVGARKFGNLLDPNSEIRKVIKKKRVFRFKEELGTEPKFFYFMD